MQPSHEKSFTLLQASMWYPDLFAGDLLLLCWDRGRRRVRVPVDAAKTVFHAGSGGIQITNAAVARTCTRQSVTVAWRGGALDPRGGFGSVSGFDRICGGRGLALSHARRRTAEGSAGL